MSSPRANLAVVARRAEPPDALDYFPTPPWATRAFMSELCARALFVRGESILEPACGEGHMAAVMAEFSGDVTASDVFPYGYGARVDFLDDGCAHSADWIITNPPFNRAVQFLERALEHPASRADVGVAFLVRLAWLETAQRGYLFQRLRPTLVLIHSDRVPMHKGRWEPRGKSATAYAWVVWIQPQSLRAQTSRLAERPTELGWIGPGARAKFDMPDDVRRFVPATPAPLLEGVP